MPKRNDECSEEWSALVPQAGCKGTHEERMQFADSDAGCDGMSIRIACEATRITQPVAAQASSYEGSEWIFAG